MNGTRAIKVKGWHYGIKLKVKGPWKNQFNNDVPDDGISLEEEQNEPNSIWNFYRKMIAMRKANPVISEGIYQTLQNNSDQVFAFMRYKGNKKFIVAVNLSDKTTDVNVNVTGAKHPIIALYGSKKPEMDGNIIKLHLAAYGIEVWTM